MSLGALVKGMRAMRLHDSQPTEPFNGYSVLAIEKALCRIEVPEYHQALRREVDLSLGNPTTAATIGSMKPGDFTMYWMLSCRLDKKIRPIILHQLAKLQGLRLESFASSK